MLVNKLFLMLGVVTISSTPLLAQNATNWALSGNTVSSAPALGTKNNFPIRFIANNQTAGYTGADGKTNVTFGMWSMNPSVGSDNTAMGYNSLGQNKSGYQNTAMGLNSLLKNTTGFQNTAIGSYAMLSNTTGYHNVGLGNAALYLNTEGYENTAIGLNSLYNNSTGKYNTGLGYQTLFKNTTGDYNTGLGYQALLLNTTGYWNTGLGTGALQENTTGFFNTAVGTSALFANTTGQENTAVGEEAMAALAGAMTGSYNTALGLRALDSINSGSNNTAIGYRSLDHIKDGNNNTALGLYTDVASSGFENATILGFGAFAYKSHAVYIGNNNVASVVSHVTISIPTDKRIVKNVEEDVPGLEFINRLKPVTFNYNLSQEDQILRGNDIPNALRGNGGRSQKESIKFSGFVAQDVQDAADETKYDFSGVDKANSDKQVNAVRYADFIAPIVKAIQDLSNKVDSLQHKIDSLEEITSNPIVGTSSPEVASSSITANSKLINYPNPFTYSTNISYELPETATNPTIRIMNANGTVVKVLNLSNKTGNVQLDLSDVISGIYYSSLMANGKVFKTAKMIVAR